MLGTWQSHDAYIRNVVSELSFYSAISQYFVYQHENIISKLYILNLDTLKPIIAPLYSVTGRPSNYQPEMFRTFIVMNDLKKPIDLWSETLRLNPILRIICGFPSDYIPSTASFYDFMNRLYRLDDRPRVKKKKRKPKKKIGKNVKLPHKKDGITDALVKQILKGRRFNNRPDLTLQTIFAEIAVKRSLDLGLISNTLDVSGDGTCILTGGSSYGVKVCKCNEKGIYNCKCPRKFCDPDASWGWDSSKEQWFFGYSGYFLSTYNPDLKCDLPLYLRLLEAKRHDSISAVITLAEFRDLYPNLTIENFMSDSASDNYATYELLYQWNINPIIALNSINKRGNFKNLPEIQISDNGIPICPAGHNMCHWGLCGSRHRIKWRCPRALDKVDASPQCKTCSNSNYGRTFYTKPEDDLRLFTKVPRGSQQWKDLMKKRTSAERINDRILNDYGIENSKTKGKKRISFMVTIASINIHLDAQLAKMKSDNSFSFENVFGLKAA